MTKITDPVKLEAARARMAKARASRTAARYPDDVEQRVDTVRQLVFQQFKDNGLSATYDGKLAGGPTEQYYRNKLIKGTLNLRDIIMLNDYLPIDWSLILKSVRRPKEVMREADTEAAAIEAVFVEPGTDPFADYFTDVDGA